MASADLVEVGSVRKTHGYGGELKVAFGEPYAAVAQEAKFLFVGADPEGALPFEVVELRGERDIVRFAGVNSKEAAVELRGHRLYLRAKDVARVPQAPEASDRDAATAKAYEKFIGFAVIDDDLGEVGAITTVEAFPGQALANVDYEGRERLVPMSPDLIKGVDFTKKIVFMRLPEGLLEL